MAILGDMFELGENEIEMHYEVGQYVAGKQIDVLVAIGKLGENYAKGAKEYLEKNSSDCQVLYFEDRDSALQELEQIIQPQDAVLVKASHGMHFEKIVEKLQK